MRRTLTWASIIFVGMLLLPVACMVIIGGASIQTPECQQSAGGVTLQPTGAFTVNATALQPDGFAWTPERISNATLIADIGMSRGAPRFHIELALITAMHEAELLNLEYGDRDSLGLYQMRPTLKYWGTAAQIMDPVYAINRHYDELEKFDNLEQLGYFEAAIEVQNPSRSAYQSRWSQNNWEASAKAFLSAGNAVATDQASSAQTVAADLSCIDGSPASQAVEIAVQAATSQVGTPYKWGGESETDGFDCSGLMLWAYEKAGVQLPRNSRAQYSEGTKVVSREDLRRGDLMYYANDTSNPATIHHVSMYLGNNQMIEAPYAGAFVRVVPSGWDGFIGATRPIPVESQDAQLVSFGNLSWQPPLVGQFRKSSPFGMRVHPTKGTRTMHNGQDWAAPAGTPIHAAANGTIAFAALAGDAGNMVRITHDDGFTTVYMHLSRFELGISPDARVQKGHIIGYVGDTGDSTNPHLHFEVRKGDNTPVDPITFLRENGLQP